MQGSVKDYNHHAIPICVSRVSSCMNTERSTSTLDPSPTQAPASSSKDPSLPNDVATLQAMIRELIDALHKEQREREGVQQRLDLLLRKLYGPFHNFRNSQAAKTSAMQQRKNIPWSNSAFFDMAVSL
jgi:hypothetical protein